MKDKYTIINKTAVQKRIEELKKLQIIHSENGDFPDKVMYEKTITEKITLKYILSQSTPLIPEIEKAILEGRNSIHFENDGSYWEDENVVEDYITNLKLDI